MIHLRTHGDATHGESGVDLNVLVACRYSRLLAPDAGREAERRQAVADEFGHHLQDSRHRGLLNRAARYSMNTAKPRINGAAVTIPRHRSLGEPLEIQ